MLVAGGIGVIGAEGRTALRMGRDGERREEKGQRHNPSEAVHLLQR
jgi:hypothetical protein